jgi:thymidylate synthase
MRVSDIRTLLLDEYRAGNFTLDKTGQKTIEILGASFIADEPAIFGTPNEEYIKKEIDWYMSMSTNIYDINKESGADAPAAWKYAADTHGNINSNYGHIVFSRKYHDQFYCAHRELIDNPDSRRAQMIYNRPSIWVEFNEGGKSDFICTNAQTFYIRDNKLHMVSQMRSNDVVFGYKNDYAWAKYLMQKMADEINWVRDVQGSFGNQVQKLEIGDLTWQVMNLHVYDRHFHLLDEYE